jgi:hypothetical protein
VLNLLLTIPGHSALTAGGFLLLNLLTLASICSLYAAYLFFLTRKRLRAGLYGTFPSEE